MVTQKGFAPILIILLIVFLGLGTGGYFIYTNNSNNQTDPPDHQTACTLETKICPDGTSVGRSGPNCEFATCPNPKSTSSAETLSFKTYISTISGIPKFSFKYPSNWHYSIEQSQFSYTLQENYPSTIINFGELATKNHIGQTVTSYVNPIFGIHLTTVKDINSINIENLYDSDKNLPIRRTIKEVQVDGIAAKQINHLGCLTGDCMDVLFKRNNTLFDLRINEDASIKKHLDFLNQMVSTFKFLP